MAENNVQMALSPRQVFSDQRVRRIPGSAMRIGTWNTRSIYEAGKIHNVEQEMNRLKLDILGLSDTRLPGSDQHSTTNGYIYCSGSSKDHHRYGVAVIVSKEINKSVLNFSPISDRIMLLQLRMVNCKLNIVQIYAPTADKSDDEIEEFYGEVDNLLSSLKNRDVTLVLGDFNAKIGKGKVGKYIGEYGLGARNERGDRLVQFSQENDLVITNTFFKLPSRRLYTWKSPQDKNGNIVRNQIDYILIKYRYRNSIKSVKTYPGADISSDHNPVIANFKIKLKKCTTKPSSNQLNVSLLKNTDIKQELKFKINDNLKRCKENAYPEGVDEKWYNIKQAILEPSKETLQKRPEVKQEWMTPNILLLMDKRRKAKNNHEEYKNIQREIRDKVREAKEEYYKKKCEEIEDLQRRYDNFGVHKKVKELTGTQKRRQISVLKDEDGKLITEIEEKMRTWTNYIKDLFDDNRNELEELEELTQNSGPEITKEEVIYTLKILKNARAPGPDEIPNELLKLIEEEHIDILVNLFNSVYDSGHLPEEWLVSTFVTLPKKANAKQCNDYRTISLMSHTLKTFLKIIHHRVYRKLEEDISETQFGFREGLGTREALFAVNVLSQRCMDMNQPLYVCFIDYNKAFDKVRHEKLMSILKEKNLDGKDIRIISKLYFNQKAIIKVENQQSTEIEIKRGVRQGCVLSPMLFNIYSEEIMKDALENENRGVKVNGKVINIIRYADDTILIATSLEDLQFLLQRVARASEEHGLTLNAKKTKFMLISKNPQVNVNLVLENETIERVERYKYLGTMINQNSDCSEEIKTRVEQARATFMKMKRVFCSRDLKLELKVRLLRCYVFSVLFYGMECWTLKKTEIRRLNAFEMWLYRRIHRISWTERVTNEIVMQRMKKEKEIVITIKKRKLQYLGHLMRGDKYELLQLIIQGKIQGKRSMGRRRHSWLRNLREWFNCSSSQLFRSAVSKIRIALMIANLRNEDGT